MVLRTQIVFDAAQPHDQAGFWASALHYEHEEIDAFVSGLVDSGQVPAEVTIEVDGKRRWRTLASLRHPDDPVDERGAGTGRRILFQAVPEAKTTKNRVHLDLAVGRTPATPRAPASSVSARRSSMSTTGRTVRGR